MRKRVIDPNEKKTESIKKRMKLLDPFAIGMWCILFIITAVLAVLSALTGFNKIGWYGDALTLLDWFVGLLSLINLFATFSVGIRLENGVVDLGKQPSGERETFESSLLLSISVTDVKGEELPLDKKLWKNASLCFHLSGGKTRRSRTASILTARQFHKANRFFGLEDHTKG